MKANRLVAILLGLGLAAAGCIFHPDMGDRPQCERDSDCVEYGECVCVGGKCVPASADSNCDYEDYCEAPSQRCEPPDTWPTTKMMPNRPSINT